MSESPAPLPASLSSPFQVLDAVPGGCCVIGPGGTIRFWNRTLEAWTRRRAADLLGTSLFDAFPHLGLPRFRNRILDALATGAPTIFSSALNPQFFPCLRPGGRPRIQQTTLNRLLLEEGPLVLIMVNDVTDQFERGEKYRAARAQALVEARVRGEGEEKHRLIAGLTSSAILVGDAQARILDCNDSAARIFQYTQPEFLQLSLPDLFPYKHSETIRRILAEDLDTGDHGLEIEGKRKNGTSFPAEITTRFFDAGRERHFVAYVHDTTDRRRAEEAMSYARRHESLGSLAGGIAHDFNNLFCGVLGNLDLAWKQVPEGASALASYLARIQSEILRASDLSQKMLAFSGKGRFSMGQVDLNRLLEELRPRLTADLPKQAVLSFRCIEGLPRIEGDPVQLQQVIQYLVINAGEALGEDAGTIELSTSIQDLDAETIQHAFPGQRLKPGLHVTLEVADTGCGISPENLPRIFDPFFSTKFVGRGLSLAVALGILRGHEAGCAITSAPGAGTRFKLFFPTVPGTSPLPVQELPQAPLPGRSILFVDDEPTLREAACEMLELSGYRVILARDGLEALACYEAHAAEIGLIIMDLTMPRMDGRAAFQAILARNPDAKVVLSSGYTEHDAIQQFLGQHLAGFLPKPYRMSQLEELARRFVRPDHG